MRLLNVHTSEILEFSDDIPPYAILSHRWGSEEVSFADYVDGNASSLDGYNKIIGCCKQAASDSLGYVWIDTCCIDKRSSAELSEAINSMFSWYRDAVVCYVYLEDIPRMSSEQLSESRAGRPPTAFQNSLWFTRGWTLQELIAPSVVIFYSSDWVNIGTRDTLRDAVAVATGIDPRFFNSGELDQFSVAQRMSWASSRRTTRIEDQAYSLLGLFGVNMPLLYGEGRRAFIRLQEEIIKQSDDQSIFAWATTSLSDRYYTLNSGGLLAPSPAEFANSGCIVRRVGDEYNLPYAITNKGIQISLPMANIIDTYDPVSLYVYKETIPPGSGPHWAKRNITGSNDLIGSDDLIDAFPFREQPPNARESYYKGSSIAILNCGREDDLTSRVVVILQEVRYPSLSGHLYERTNYAFGLSVAVYDEIRSKAVQKQLFIQSHNALGTIMSWSSRKRMRRVIIEPFDSPASSFKFTASEPPGDRYQRQEKGSVLLHFYEFSDILPYKLRFEHAEGNAFFIVLNLSTNNARVIGNVDIFYSAMYDLPVASGENTPKCHQKSPDGLLDLRLNIKQAPHAIILKLDVSVLPGTKSGSKRRRVHPPDDEIDAAKRKVLLWDNGAIHNRLTQLLFPDWEADSYESWVG